MSRSELTPRSTTAAPAANSVGRYEILSEIGRGGMGLVHLARQTDLERLVALKALHGVYGQSSDAAEQFIRESRLAGALSHPNIVTVYEYFEHAGVPYISMEYLPGGSLRPWVGHLAFAQLAGVLEGLLAGLAAVEPSGSVHCDLKPENVMVTADGRVKIADFGIVQAAESASGAIVADPTSGITMGTPAYMAPEQALSEPLGPWTDLYSVGVITYEQVVGKVPFHETRTPMAMLLRHVNDPIPSLADVRPDLDPSLSDWAARLLARNPERRTSSAKEAWEEFEEIVIRQLGPLWRRESLLRTKDTPERGDPAVTTAQFLSQRISVPIGAGPTRDSTTETPVARSTIRSLGTPRSQRRLRALLGRQRMLALTATAAIASGFLLVRELRAGTVAEPLSGRAATRSFSLSYPRGWQAGAGVTPALTKLVDAVTLRASHRPVKLTVGLGAPSDSTLLPRDLLAELSSPPRGQTVLLGGHQYYRYLHLSMPPPSSIQTAYATRTTAGVVVGLCSVTSVSVPTTSGDCERILGSLKLNTGRYLPPAPAPAYARALAAAVSALNRQRAPAFARFVRARSAAGESSASGQLSSVYRRAAQALRVANAGVAERALNVDLSTSLQEVASGYATMTAGARAGDPVRYNAGRSAATSATARLEASLAALPKLGYHLQR
jgi:serine/threonine protein kinase